MLAEQAKERMLSGKSDPTPISAGGSGESATLAAQKSGVDKTQVKEMIAIKKTTSPNNNPRFIVNRGLC